MTRGQGAFEYILMLAGLLLVVLLILVVLQGTQAGTQQDIKIKSCYSDLLKNTGCFSSSASFDLNRQPASIPTSCTSIGTTVLDDQGYCANKWDCGDLSTNLRPSGTVAQVAGGSSPVGCASGSPPAGCTNGVPYATGSGAAGYAVC